MPVVAGRSGNLLVRNLRLALLRGIAGLLSLLLVILGLAEIWFNLLEGAPPRDDMVGSALIRYLRPSAETSRIRAEASSFLQAAEVPSNGAPSPQLTSYLDEIDDALSLHPMQPHLWLIRATLFRQQGEPDDKIAESLKMVYLTSPVSGELAFDRLDAGLKLQNFDDPELVEFLKGDISGFLLQRVEQQSRLLDAYRAASPAGKTFLERVVADLKPEYLSALK